MCQDGQDGVQNAGVRFQGVTATLSAPLGSSFQLVSDQLIIARILNFNLKVNINFSMDSQSIALCSIDT